MCLYIVWIKGIVEVQTKDGSVWWVENNSKPCSVWGVGVDRGGIKLVHGMGFVNAGVESLGDWVGSRFHSVRIWMGSGLGEVVVEVSQVSRGRGDLRLWWSRSGPARPHESGTTSQPSTRSRDHSATS